jgi:hypothetical protein
MNPLDLFTPTAGLITRLERQPQFYNLVAALLDEVENRAEALKIGDQAEDTIVKRIRQIGQQALSRWAEHRYANVQPAATGKLPPRVKKSVGKSRSAGLRSPNSFGAAGRRRGAHFVRPAASAIAAALGACNEP